MNARMFSIIALCAVAGQAAAQPSFRHVAFSGWTAPGTGGAHYSAFMVSNPSINSAGQVAFAGSIDMNPDECIWSEGTGVVGLVAREGSAAPDAGGAVYSTIGSVSPSQDSSGNVAFQTRLSGTGVTSTNDLAIWAGMPLAMIVREGSTVSGTEIADLNTPALYGDGGKVAFGALVRTPTTQSSVWSNISGSPVMVARNGVVAAGAGGATFSSMSTDSLRMNASGRIIFGSRLSGTGVTGTNDDGIWSDVSGTLALVVRDGDAAPGVSGGLLNNVSLSSFNNAGQFAIGAGLLGSVTSANNAGIWAGAAGALALVARKGDAAPGCGGALFSAFGVPQMNGNGKVVFYGTLTGAGVTTDNDEGVWSDVSGTLALIIREGDAAPGGSEVFGRFGVSGPAVFDPTINKAGQIAIVGSVKTVGTSNPAGIWMTDDTNTLIRVIRKNTFFDVDPSAITTDLREITSFDVVKTINGLPNASEDGRPRCLNDDGELALKLVFANGGAYGMYVATVAPPTSCCVDFNGDEELDFSDIEGFLAAYAAQTPGTCAPGADMNNDGEFDFSDIESFLALYAAGC